MAKTRKYKDEEDDEAKLTPIESTLLKARTLFLCTEVGSCSIEDLMAQIIAMDARKVAPITLFINSPGGDIMSGLALIDLMDTIKSPVNTVVLGEACSMAAIIAICGKKRSMGKNAVIMFHEGFYFTQDYLQKAKCRQAFFDKLEIKMDLLIQSKSKFSKEQLDLMKNGELWLDSSDAMACKIVDRII
jgi:ATP-dependent Clp protease protease subunit